jgi:glycosyltransferase involved in cell wall biosynthesis
MAPAPLVTIGLPTYNGARFLEETLESLLAQHIADLEIIISDNGSTDGTRLLCERAARDRRVTYVRSAVNRGAAWNYNRVLALASGRYFKWAADDDVCLPSFLTVCLDELETSAGAVLAWPETLIVDEAGRAVSEMDDRALDLRDGDPVHRLTGLLRHRVEWHPVFGVIRRDALVRTRGIGSFVCADVALLAELALVGAFHQVPERLFLRRYHDGRSLVANPSFRAHAAWYDPANDRRRAVYPNGRLVRELLQRCASAPLPAVTRARASEAVLRCWALPHWRHIGGELKRGLPIVGQRWAS